ncbi:MAG TPA: prepilin peptidase [Caldithrix abyssi]|uniref:Prepilin peptidase n=1 Tax=Caldithrix abyssi TaxID=187145 RepID=A0A7V1LMM5_CALAY|nr:prepilin peptidase [Caldithrix abyssi]
MTGFLVFLLGLAIGSFLNVVVYRLPRSLSLSHPRSACPHCHAPIAAYDNIPVLSYLLLKGKCRHCRAAIPWQYPVVELITAVLFFIVYYDKGLTVRLPLYLLFLAFMISIALIDIKTGLILDRQLMLMLGLGVVLNLLFPFIGWKEALTGMLAGAGSMYLIAFLGRMMLKKESLGFGDVKFAAVAGFYLGVLPTLAAAYIGFVLAFVAILVSKALHKSLPRHIPLGPFLAGGFFLFLLWGHEIGALYLSLVQPR